MALSSMKIKEKKMKKEVMICDRCGKMYEPGQEVIVPCGPDKRGIKTLYDVIITYRARTSPEGNYYRNNSEKELDLCPACANLFFNWLLLTVQSRSRLEDDK